MKNCFIDQRLLKRVISESHYALMYACNKTEGRLGLPVIVKADETIEPRSLFCTTDDTNVLCDIEGQFPVILRFINKKNGNFIRMQGVATVIVNTLQAKRKCESTSISLEILQIAWVYKKTGKVEFFI